MKKYSVHLSIIILLTCISPAHAEAANDTASNATFFDPPNSVKGDLARALMYVLYVCVWYTQQRTSNKHQQQTSGTWH